MVDGRPTSRVRVEAGRAVQTTLLSHVPLGCQKKRFNLNKTNKNKTDQTNEEE